MSKKVKANLRRAIQYRLEACTAMRSSAERAEFVVCPCSECDADRAALALADVVDALELVKGVAVTRQCCIVCGVAAQHAPACPVAALEPFLENR